MLSSNWHVKPGTHWRQSWIQHGRLCWKSTVAKTGKNRQQSRLLPIRSTLLPIRSTLLPVLATNRQQCKFDSSSRSTLLPIRSTLLPIRSTLLPVYGAKPTRSTLSTFHRVDSTLSPMCTGLNAATYRFRDIRGQMAKMVHPSSFLTLHLVTPKDIVTKSWEDLSGW